MPEPISTVVAFGVGGWLLKKGANVVTDITIGQSVSKALKPKRDALVQHIRNNWLGCEDAPAANHDLQRAFAMAICKAADVLLVQIENAISTPRVSDHSRPDAEAFVARTGETINELRKAALARQEIFVGPIEDDLLRQVIMTTPEANIDAADSEALTIAIGRAFQKLLEQRDGEALPPIATSHLEPSEAAERFGSRVMGEFIEILKSGDFPQATIAFEHRISGEILSAIEEISSELEGISELPQMLREQVVAQIEAHANELQAAVLGIEEHFHDQKRLLSDINDRLAQWATLPLSAKPALRHDTRNPFYKMAFESRLTRFTGRDRELAQLKLFLEDNSGHKAKVCWWQIAGTGGQGKSRLALQLVDELGPDWHAGFLSESALIGDGPTVDWYNVELHRPTLCVIDYIAAPAKARAFAQAIKTLLDRANAGPGSPLLPLLHPIRFLVLERSGFTPDDGEQAGTATWIDTLRSDAGMQLDVTVYDQFGALDLEDLSHSAMVDIGNSWRDQSGWPPMTSEQEKELIKILDRRHGDGERNRRAWRPLFAMLFAEILGEGDDLYIGQADIEDILRQGFARERAENWRDAATGNVIVPVPEAIRVACLATMIGGLDLQAAIQQLGGEAYGDTLPATDFYGIKPETVEQVWMVLGLRQAYQAGPLPRFPARQPDLLGEYMLIWAIEPMLGQGFFNEDDPALANRLARDAWHLKADAFLACLIRMREDFPKHPVTKALAGAPIPKEISITISGNALNNAAYFGLTGLAESLLNSGYMPDDTIRADGAFPLLYAALGGRTEMVVLLLAAGAEPNQVDETNGFFPLLTAATSGHTEVVERLLAAGAEPNQLNPINGSFPLQMAAHQGYTEVVVLLLEAEADPNQVHRTAGTFPLLEAAHRGHTEVVDRLLRAGAAPDQVDPINGAFPLLVASQNGHAATVRILLTAGAEPNRVHETNGIFSLLMAVEEGHTEAVERLLEAEADPNRVHGRTGAFPLLMAAYQGHTEAAERLLAAGADPNQLDPINGNFPLLAATTSGHTGVVEQLLAAGANPNQVLGTNGIFPLLTAATGGYAELAERLLAAGANPNQVLETNGSFPLFEAALNGRTEVIEVLVQRGADVNQSHVQTGATPIVAAGMKGFIDIVLILSNAGATIR